MKEGSDWLTGNPSGNEGETEIAKILSEVGKTVFYLQPRESKIACTCTIICRMQILS